MTIIRRTISLLLLMCCMFSLFPAPFAGADSCTHIPDATGHCSVCGALLVTDNYSEALNQIDVLTDSPESLSSKASSVILPASESEMPSGCSHVFGEDGCCELCGMEIVASGDNIFFGSLQDAFAYGGNILLMRDIDSTEDTSVTVKTGQSVSLDLNGKKLGIEHLFSINNYGTLTVYDSSDDQGEIFGNIYTKGFEEREYNKDGSYVVVDSAYGAKTIISGGRLLGDVEVGHDPDRSYIADESKPNPSLVFEDGYLIGGRFSLPEKERGEIHINGGCFTVEPPASFIKKGCEAGYSDGYYRIVRIKYIAGWEATAVSVDSGMSAHTEAVARENSAVNDFYTDDFGYVDVTDILFANGLVFTPGSDRVACTLEINARSAVTEGEGVSEKVTSMSFSVNPVFRFYHGGEIVSLNLNWEQIEGWGTTMRFPVDSAVTNKYVNVYSGDMLIQEKVEICSAGEDKYAQLYVGKEYFDAGIRYEVYVPEVCAVLYTPEDGSGEPIHESVAGGGTLTVRKNPYMRDHYTFAGWLGSDGIVYSEDQELSYIIDDMDFSALWEPDRYDLIYELNGGENSPNNPLTYVYNDTVYLSDPEKKGAVFAGWYDNPLFEGEPVSALLPGMFGEKKLYAEWKVSITVIISGDGSGIVADSSKQYSSGDAVELLSGESFSARIFNAEDSYISAVLINGENIDISSELTLGDIQENMVIEVEFSSTSAVSGQGQFVDFSEVKAENGSELSDNLLNRAEDAFGNSNVLKFSDTGIEEAVDFDVAKNAFEAETGEKVGEYDSVNIVLRMSVLTVNSDDGNRITGYKIDIKPVMTVVSADGIIKNSGVPVVIPNEAITHAVSFRIPIDQLTFMDDIIVFHEGELMGYFKIEGEAPNRYVELATDSFSVFEVQVIIGSTNHPQAAIGQYGYTSLMDAVARVKPGETIFLLVPVSEIADIPAADEVSAQINTNSADTYPNLRKMIEDELKSKDDVAKIIAYKGNGGYCIRLASDDIKPEYFSKDTRNPGEFVIVYVGNGGRQSEGKDTVVDIVSSGGKIKSNEEINFKNGSLLFMGWNTEENGTGTFVSPGDAVEKDETLYAIWKIKAKVRFRDGTEEFFSSLDEACAACEPREGDKSDTIILMDNITDELTVKFDIELLIDLNGFDIIVGGNSFKAAPEKFIELKNTFTILKYTDSGYQVRKAVKINYELNGGSFSPALRDKVKTTSFLDSDQNVYAPNLSEATFKGWYYDKDFTDPVNPKENKKYSIPAVPAPAWPEDITIYARWVYTITVYNNNYGYIEYGGRKLSSGEKIEVNMHSDNKFTFHPYDGYKVYNVTADNVKKGECYTIDFNDVKANHIFVVTFARGFYNPFTGDSARCGFWLALMGLSALLTGAAILLRRRKEKQ